MAQGDDRSREAVEAREHRGVGRRGWDVGRVVVLEERAALGEAVDMRSGLAVVAVATHVVGAEAVDTEENDIGFFAGHGILAGER